MLKLSMLGTLAKAQQVLDLYSLSRPEWGVGEVAAQCGWPPSSTHLLMSSLAQMGLLHRTAAGRYRLGFKLHHLSQILLQNTPWRDVVAARLSELSRQCGETTYAAALDGQQLIAVFSLRGHAPGAISPAALSDPLPLHASAAGKVMLADRTVHDRSALPRRLPALTGRTITGRAELFEQLQQVRQQGYALNLAELQPELCAVAAPVFNHSGEVIAAVSLLAPAERFSTGQGEYTAQIVQAAREISRQLGDLPERNGAGELVWVSRGGVEQLQARGGPRHRKK